MKLAYKTNVNFRPTKECLDMIPYVMYAYEMFVPEQKVLTITSANDSQHMTGSKHFENNALDFRVWGLEAWQRKAVVAKLNCELGPDYQFVDEVDHIHSEFDPR